MHLPVQGYSLRLYPVPNSLTTLGIGLLATVVSWQWAGKIWILCYFALSGEAVRRLSRALDVRSTLLWFLLPGSVFLNLDFWYGHINFEIGMCLLLIMLSLLLKGQRKGWHLNALLVLLYFTHMEACACGMLLQLCFTVQRRSIKHLFPLFPAVALTGWYATARFRAGPSDSPIGMAGQYRYGSFAYVLFKLQSYVKTLGYVNVVSSNGNSFTYVLLGRYIMVSLATLSFIIGIALVFGAFKAVRLDWRLKPQLRYVWVLIGSLLLIGTLAPQSILGTSDPGSRLTLIAACLSMFLIVETAPRFLGIAAFCSLTLCICNLWQFERVAETPEVVVRSSALPGLLQRYAHVEPATRLQYYRSLERNCFKESIFPTAMFRETTTQ